MQVSHVIVKIYIKLQEIIIIEYGYNIYIFCNHFVLKSIYNGNYCLYRDKKAINHFNRLFF